MRVRYLVSAAGPHYTREAGHEYEVSDKEGVRLCEMGRAVPVRSGKTVETASIDPGTSRRKYKKRKQ